MGLILGPDGGSAYSRPEANALTEERVNAELQAVDALLFLKWIDAIYWNPREKTWEGRYAIACWWPDADPRRQQVRENKLDPNAAFDILGWACEDMQDASSLPRDPASMLRRILDLLASCDNTRQPWKARMRQVIEHNARRRQQIKDEATDMAADEAATQYYHTSRASRVFVDGQRDQQKEA